MPNFMFDDPQMNNQFGRGTLYSTNGTGASLLNYTPPSPGFDLTKRQIMKKPDTSDVAGAVDNAQNKTQNGMDGTSKPIDANSIPKDALGNLENVLYPQSKAQQWGNAILTGLRPLIEGTAAGVGNIGSAGGFGRGMALGGQQGFEHALQEADTHQKQRLAQREKILSSPELFNAGMQGQIDAQNNPGLSASQAAGFHIMDTYQEDVKKKQLGNTMIALMARGVIPPAVYNKWLNDQILLRKSGINYSSLAPTEHEGTTVDSNGNVHVSRSSTTRGGKKPSSGFVAD